MQDVLSQLVYLPWTPPLMQKGGLKALVVVWFSRSKF